MLYGFSRARSCGNFAGARLNTHDFLPSYRRSHYYRSQLKSKAIPAPTAQAVISSSRRPHVNILLSFTGTPMRTRNTALLLIILLSMSSILAGAPSEAREKPVIKKEAFGNAPDGPADLYTIVNSHGMEVRVTNYGGIIVSLRVPDKKGVPGDVVLGYDNLDGYLKNSPYFSAIVGRYAHRIANGKFTLGGVEYHLAKNNGPNSLHGGLNGSACQMTLSKPFKPPWREFGPLFLAK